MLSGPHRLRRSSDFAATVRRGRRSGRSDIVVHVLTRDNTIAVDAPGQVRFGLVISKAVGPAVTRHRVARRLRHIGAALASEIRPDVDIVLRALPTAATASSLELTRQVTSSLIKLGAVTRR